MSVRLLTGDCRQVLKTLADQSVHCCVTSPPYFGLRDYGVDGQIGLEQSPVDFVHELVSVFREVRRVLRDDGTLFLNLGDSYWASGQRQTGRNDTSRETPGGRGGSFRGGVRRAIAYDNPDKEPEGTIPFLKPKDLIGIPWRVAFALQADGWYLRQDIIWSKPNPMPESVTDRCTKAHEYIFMLSKRARYHFDADAVRDAPSGRTDPIRSFGKTPDRNDRNSDGYALDALVGRNKRSVWTVATAPFSEAHFATFPPALIEPCIKAGCPKGGTVLDPFAGAGTTGMVADRLGRNSILIELNPAYAEMSHVRHVKDAGMFAEVSRDGAA